MISEYHLHMFTIDGLIYGDPADDEFGEFVTQDEARFRLNQVISREDSDSPMNTTLAIAGIICCWWRRSYHRR
jgi:hypothetical protein